MKSKLLIAIAGAVCVLPAGAYAQSSGDVIQSGNNNNGTINQFAGSSAAASGLITQTGDNLTATIDQGASGFTATITQTGANHIAESSQRVGPAVPGVVTIEQSDSGNEAFVVVRNTGAGASLNDISVTQSGGFQVANVNVNGSENTIDVSQSTFIDNVAQIDLLNSSNANSVDVDQIGGFGDIATVLLDDTDNNVISVEQDESGAQATISVTGTTVANTVDVIQTEIFGRNVADVSISGAAVDGNNSVVITQASNSPNSALVDITGSNATFTATQTDCTGCSSAQFQR